MNTLKKFTSVFAVMAMSLTTLVAPTFAEEYSYEDALVKDTDFTVAYTSDSNATNKWFNQSTDVSNERGNYILDFGSDKSVILTQIDICGAGDGAFVFYGSDTYDETFEVCTDDNKITETALVNTSETGEFTSYTVSDSSSYRYIYMKLKNSNYRDKAYEIVFYGYVFQSNSLKNGIDFNVAYTSSTTATSGWFDRTFTYLNDRGNYILDFGKNKAVTLSQIDIYGAGTGAFEFYGSDTYDESFALCTNENLIIKTDLKDNDSITSYTASDSGSYRYIYMKLANSNYKDKAREIVLCGTVEDVKEQPTGTLTQVYTSEGKDVEGEATAWTLEVAPGSYSGNVSVTVDTVTKTTETTVSGGTYVFGLAIAKIVDAGAISATLGETAIVIE